MKIKMFEATTTSYGKGYVLAKNEQSAFRKIKRLSPHETFIPSMTTHYATGTKKQLMRKYKSWGLR